MCIWNFYDKRFVVGWSKSESFTPFYPFYILSIYQFQKPNLMHLQYVLHGHGPTFLGRYPVGICYSASFMVRSQADATHISACQDFLGTLYLKPSTDTDTISLEGLQVVGAVILMHSPHLRNISSSTLRTVVSNLVVSNVTSLQELHLPHLRTASSIEIRDVTSPLQVTFSKDVQVYDCSFTGVAFPSGSLPEIGGITGRIQVMDNPGLRLVKLPIARILLISIRAHADSKFPLQVEFPALKNCSDMNMLGVAQIKIPKLIRLDNFNLESSQAPSISIPRLTKVRQSLAISTNENLSSLSLPSMEYVGEHIYIYGNNMLKELSLPKLSHVGKTLLTDGSFEKYFRFRYFCHKLSVLTCLQNSSAFSKRVFYHEHDKQPSIEL
jgi:hypothetical protein